MLHFWQHFDFPVCFAPQFAMSIRLPKNRPEPARNFKVLLNGFMALAYTGSGLFLLLVPGSGRIIATEYIKVLSVSLILYGIFRAVRAYLSFKSPKF